MSSLDELLSSAIEATLAPFLDEDICEYIQSILEEDPNDQDARENVQELLRGSIDPDADPESVITQFFAKLKFENDNGVTQEITKKNYDDEPLQLLTKAMTMKQHDISSYASGLSAEPMMADHEDETISAIASFYANMIDGADNEGVVSERNRRKEKQKAMREEMEDAERQRAIQEAMDVLNEDKGDDNPDDLLDAASDNSADVHMRGFDLPNLRGGGPDLLRSASLTLARGRRYGLMGRNGCGKTTFMTYLAQRQIEGAVPKKMPMLLVRQEIIGNDWTAVETVIKSDVKREGVKRFIKWCEDEIERLENGGEKKEEEVEEKEEEANGDGGDDEKGDGKEIKGSSKGRQKLMEKKKARLEKAARAKAKTTNTTADKMKKENTQYQQNKLTEKLGIAYQKLAEIEEQEGGDPEPRAVKVLSGMGFSEEMQNKPTSELSGGWRMRVSISCALFANPSLLL